MRDFIINSLLEYTKYQEKFRIDIYCNITQDMIIPDNVRESFAAEGKIMFSFTNGYGKSNAEFDFETRMLSWNTAFGGIPFRLGLPSHSIFAVSNGDGFVVQFADDLFLTPKEADIKYNTKPAKKEETKLKAVKPALKLVIDNKEN